MDGITVPSMHASQLESPPRRRTKPRPSGNTVTLRRDENGQIVLFIDIAQDFGATTNLDMARLIRCGEGTVSRLRNGEQSPGTGVIAGVAVLYAGHADRPLTRHFDFSAPRD